MKKFLLLFLTLILAVSVLAACGGNGNTNETGNQTADPSGDPADTPAENPFKIPETSMRDYVVQYMYDMSNVKWTPARDMDLRNDPKGNLVGNTLLFEKGKVYHGLPYINLLTDSDLEDFMNGIEFDESKGYYVYDCPSDRKGETALGNDCSSAILLAWKRFDPNIAAYDTGSCFPLGEKSGIYPLGNMVIGANDKTTDIIVKNTPEQTHFQALEQLQKGDMVIWRTTAGHTRMVIENHVTKNAAGKINPNKSYIITIEQTNTIDASRTDGVLTNWYVEHKYTYAQLREKNYIPTTCKALGEERVELTYEVKNANSAKTIGGAKKGSLLGEINANYPILSATIAIKDSTGKDLYSERYKVHNTKISDNVPMNVFKFDFDNTTLPAGDYTYSIVIETVCGTGEIYNVKFTK